MTAHDAPDPNSNRADQRLSRKYFFDDADMDLFFMSALSWGPNGGLDIGQAFYVASSIVDGDADSWVNSFGAYAELQNQQAEVWLQRGWRRAAGEARLKAFASYRSAWQFAQPGGETFTQMYLHHRTAFACAMQELAVPATFFNVPFAGKSLPGMFLQNQDVQAPVVLLIGGADTCFEDLYLSIGKGVFERGYSVAMVDLPGQGINPQQGLYWLTEPEQAVAAVLDVLISQFGATPGQIALFGMSLGGYFVTRSASDSRLATVIASTPLPEPGQLFAQSVHSDQAAAARAQPSTAARRSRQTMAWKAGVTSAEDFVAHWAHAKADPALVTVPFLSIMGTGDAPVFITQAQRWHEEIRSPRKALVALDAATGADGHCQVNARLRLVQETCGWLDEIFSR